VDCTDIQAEHPQKTGWDHGTFDSALALFKRVGARRLYCTHHLPIELGLRWTLSVSISSASRTPPALRRAQARMRTVTGS